MQGFDDNNSNYNIPLKQISGMCVNQADTKESLSGVNIINTEQAWPSCAPQK